MLINNVSGRHALQLGFACVVAFSANMALAREFNTVEDVIAWHAMATVTAGDLDEKAKKFFLSNSGTSDHPGLIKADLDGNGTIDVTLLTVDRKTDNAYIRIYLCDLRCSLKKAQLVGARGDVFLQQAYETSVKQTAALPAQSKEELLKNTGIRLVNFGKSAIVYYWDQQSMSIRSITTAD